MNFEKIASWFLTDAGKKFSFVLAGALSSTAMIANFVPHTIFLDQYRDIVHLYKKGFTVPVTKKMQDRFQKTLKLLEVEPEYRDLYRPFNVIGFDIFSAGTYYSKYGIMVGLPANFGYDSITDVDKEDIILNNQHIVWDTDAGKKLLPTLVLSENAQMYAIAKEIKLRETPKLIIDTFIAPTAVLATYALSQYFNKRLNLYTRALPLRIFLYGLVSTFTLGNYLLIKDFSQVYYEQKIDRELKQKSPIFKEGAKEYYSKILERNIAFRTLLGAEGERAFTPLGNENYLLRHKHIPLVHRKAFFEYEQPTENNVA